MKNPTIYWISGVFIAAILVTMILLSGRGGSETLRAANIGTNSPEVVQKNAPATPNPTTTVSPPEKDANSADEVKWDLVVLGRLNACYVCQRGSPQVNYTRILAGKILSGESKGTLTIAKIDAHVFPEGGVPMYESKEDEIVFLKKSKPDETNKDRDLYDVLDVKKATAKNLAAFRDK
jgi:hypothetical protein